MFYVNAARRDDMTDYEQHIRARACSREEIDHFLDPDKLSVWQFDPEVGYILYNYPREEGVDGSSTILTTQRNGRRNGILYGDRPRRINTYGNSYTQCAQVNDQETWQEYLAAHLGEPVGNYGVGGFGVYQAYRRMIRAEVSDEGAEYVILFIYGDDHNRSCFRCRRASYPVDNPADPVNFEGTFWAHVEMDLEQGRIVEKEALLATPESLYSMTDPDFMYEALKDDLMLQMRLYCSESTPNVRDIDLEPLRPLGEVLDVSPDVPDDPDRRARWVRHLYNAYGFAATSYIIEHTREFIEGRNKELMIVLYCPKAARQLIADGERYDQPIVDYLRDEQIRHFDMNLVHVEDYTCFDLPVDDYFKRYHVGHYNPTGNHFFAHSIKHPVIEWLTPKPFPYRHDDDVLADFRDYLA